MCDKKNGGGAPQPNQVNQGALEAIKKAREFSSQFFTSSMQIDAKFDDSIDSKLSSFSSIYNHITTLWSHPHYNREEICENISEIIIKIINSNARDDKTSGDCLLQIESPVGAYRNKFLQLIYLRLCEQWNIENKLPFYINFANYEKDKTNVDNDFKQVSDIIAQACKAGVKNFVIILDCVREFSCGMEAVYAQAYKNISDIQGNVICDIVVGVDTNFAFGSNKRALDTRIAFLGDVKTCAGNVLYKNRLIISSMQVSRVEECKMFIRACFNGIATQYGDDKVEYCYSILEKLRITRIDAYLLKILIEAKMLEEEQDIVRIYERIVFQGLMETEKNEIASIAYNYEFCQNVSAVGQGLWTKIIMHRSIMDFLIAYHYAKSLKEMDAGEIFSEDIPQIFNMVFPNSINKFALSYLKQEPNSSDKLLVIAEDNEKYRKLSSSGISQLAYWLGRIKIDVNRQKKALNELLEYAFKKYDTINARINSHREVNDSDENNLRNWLFAYRSVATSNLLLGKHKLTIQEEGKSRDIDYFKLLIKDKFLSDINSGFHLEYYGDIYPKISDGAYQLNLYDNKAKGYNTFRILAKELECKVPQNEPYNLIEVSQLLTFCKLIQARKPSSRYSSSETFNTREYLQKCKSFIEKFAKEPLYKEVDIFVREYLKFMKDEVLECESTLWSYIETKKFNELMRACTIERTGWLERQIPNPENIVEHMYNCWLIGFLFLPTTRKALIDELNQKPKLFSVGETEVMSLNKKYMGYDKNTILNMLLIHDLGETGSEGDASQRDKEKDGKIKKRSKKVEDEIMTSLFLHGTYPFINASFDEFYDCWDTWRTLDNSDSDSAHINAKIAKDIDNIQTAYQYCYFFNKYSKIPQEKRKLQIKGSVNRNLGLRDLKMNNEQIFDAQDLYIWLNRLSQVNTMSKIRTEMGKLICFMLIYKNPTFESIVRQYNENVDIQNNTFKKWGFDKYNT